MDEVRDAAAEQEATAPWWSPARLLRAVPGLLLYVLGAVAIVVLWPTSLGGCTTLTVVSGTSMEPTYLDGDIVVSRCGSPAVGDAVVYQPEELGGARIIHRIVGGDAEQGWVLQGDNNDWLDPFQPVDAEVLGINVLHLPKLGLVARTLMNPWVWVSLILVALGLLLWPSSVDEADGDGEDDDTRDDAQDEPDDEPADALGSAPDAEPVLA